MSKPEIIEWRAAEYEFYPKDQNWYWGVGLVAVALALIALLTANFLLVILIIVAAFGVIMYGARPPQTAHFALSPKGVRCQDRLYPYDYLRSFWVLEEPRRKLILESARPILPHIILPLAAEVSPESLRVYLRSHLPEVRQEESLADHLSDYFGF